MGNSVELLGLACFNVFIALILSVTFLSNVDDKTGLVLNEQKIENFITDVSEIADGKRSDMTPFDITSFFMRHIAEDSRFKTTIRYNTPHTKNRENALDMDKMNFISNMLQSMKTIERHESLIEIDHVRIHNTGRSATVVTTNYERGYLPVPDESGHVEVLPFKGVSYCEQTIVMTKSQTLQMGGAECMTDISLLDRFGTGG